MDLLTHVQKLAVKQRVPKVKPGLTVRVHQKIQEGGKTRIQIFEGIIIKVNSGFGADKTFTVRKVVDGIGVEKTYPLYSTMIEKIEVVKSAKIRRAKLYYLRQRFGKSARMKEKLISTKDMDSMMEDIPVEEVEIKEEVAETPAEETPKVEEAKTEEVKDEVVEEPVKEEPAAEKAEEEKKDEEK